MKNKLLLLISFVSVIALMVQAQTKRQAPVKKSTTNYQIQLGKGKQNITFVTPAMLDSLMKLPVYVVDSAGGMYQATGFELRYSEWGLFEDSTGRDKIMTEYYTVNVADSVMPKWFVKQVNSMAKAGDTLTIHNVWALKKDASSAYTIHAETSSKKYIIGNK